MNHFMKHGTRVSKTINLFSYLGFWNEKLTTVGPNNHLWSVAMARLDGDGSKMVNSNNIALFWHYRVCCGSTGL